MWFSEKALVFVDTRSAALAVYKPSLSGPRLQRFASERFASHAPQSALFSSLLTDSKEAIARLARDLKAPPSGATLLLPIGASFPSIVDLASVKRAQTAEVNEDDVIRFRLAPLLPFPLAQAEVRTENTAALGNGVTLAQALPKSLIADGERALEALGFSRVTVTSALSAAFRGLPVRPGVVDLVLGDSACAIALRDALGRVEAIHLRLLLPGDDRIRRSIDEALRAASGVHEIRAAGESADSLRANAPADTTIHSAFDSTVMKGADPQSFPFLGVFEERTTR